MNLFERVKGFADAKKMSINEDEEHLGLSKNVLYKWKTQVPNGKVISMVADYFGTTTDYLLGRTDNPAIIASAEEDFADFPSAQTETELRSALENVMSFDGEAITENDKDAIIAFMLGRKGL